MLTISNETFILIFVALIESLDRYQLDKIKGIMVAYINKKINELEKGEINA